MKGLKITQTITDRQDTSLTLYFKDVSKQPMITVDEETALTRRIKEGDQLAADKLVRANLRFVISVAKQYQGKGIPLVDLIQEGNLGLIQAAKKFDETRGFRFISYAVWWIRQSIILAISSQCRTVRIPINQITYTSRINKVSDKFEQKYGRRPLPEEIEEETALSSEKIALALQSSIRQVSLEAPFSDEEAGCLLDIIPDENTDEADRELLTSNLSKKIELVLKELPFRERDIIRMSFGIGVTAMRTKEIAVRFGTGSERIRQIRRDTLYKIKTDYSYLLEDYYGK